MPGAKRTNVACVFKTFRFDPELVEDMERVIFLTREGEEKKYTSMTHLVILAIGELMKKERRVLEKEGVVWEHLKPDFKQSINKE